MLDNICLYPQEQISVLGGDVFHVLKKDDLSFSGFGEAYISFVEFGYIKAWKKHTRMSMNLVVPIGLVQFVFSVDKQMFRTYTIGSDNYSRLFVPPGIWFGFQGLSNPISQVINIASIQHDPYEVDRLPFSAIDFNWSLI